ncbi:serine-rich coiled-coil domain-containing protein 2 [Pelodytes ibericus]
MEEKIQVRASTGSRLPKFGRTNAVGNIFQRTSNGTHAGLSGQTNITRVVKHSDLNRTSAFPLSWPKPKCEQNDQISKGPLPAEKVHEKRFSLSYMAGDKDAPRLSGRAKTAGKQNNMFMSNNDDLNENLLSGLPNAAKFTKTTLFGRTAYSALNACKPQVNGFYSSKPPVGLQRPRANSATIRNFSNKLPANSVDNVKSFSHVRRSQSFSHSIQNPLLPSGALTRSYSFNRDTDLTRAYDTQRVPTRAAPKTNLLSRTSRQYELPNGNDLKSSFTRTFSGKQSTGLKTPGLSNGSAVPPSLGYKISRPSLLKPSRTQFPRELLVDGSKSSSVSSATEKTEHVSSRAGEATDDQQQVEQKELDIGSYVLCDGLDDSQDQYYSEDVDELSISSLSSSDKNDLSEDFSDDFIDLEDGNTNVTIVKSEKQMVLLPPVEYSLDSLLKGEKDLVDKPDDWLGHNETESTKSPRISPDMEYRDPSSLELSPSDSSDGTYMWDEEGMEPIRNIHPCGSYESSEMNSLDILNNLDSCDLEDDDLMLDVDLPEDPPCDIGKSVENMSNLERTERQPAFWKRAPQRLNGQEQYHLINADHYHNGRAYMESPTDRESFGSPTFYPPSPRTSQMMCLRDSTVMLDEMTLCHMVQDCTAVKTQLLKLKRLLQQEDDTGSTQDLPQSVPTTPEPQDHETRWKTEGLLNEIRQLKEESQKKDEKIQQLEHQLKTRCKCQKGSQDSLGAKPKQCEKYTQTTWRKNSQQVLQYSSNALSSTDHPLERLTPPLHTVAQNKDEDTLRRTSSCGQNGIVGTFSKVPENELSALLSTKLKIQDVEDNPEEFKKTEEPSANHAWVVNNDTLGHEQPPSSFPISSPADTKKDTQSKLTVKTTLTRQVPRPKTLQLYKSITQNTLANQGVTNSSLSSDNCLPCKASQKPTLTSSNVSAQNGCQKVVHQPPLNDCTVGKLPGHVTSNTISGSPKILYNSADSAHTLLTKPDSPPIQSKSPEVGNSKSSTLAYSVSQLQGPEIEPSKKPSKQTLKTSMLRPPGNFTSKLKKPSSPKSDLLCPTTSPHDKSKSPQKSSSSVIPRPLSYKKEEAVENSTPKKQSRLPQPKAH